MVHLDNPAGRLHQFLFRLAQQPPNPPVRSALLAVFREDEAAITDVELHRRLAVILALPAETRARVEELLLDEEDLALLLRWEEPVALALRDGTANLTVSTNAITNGYDRGVLVELEICARELHRRQAERAIEQSDLDRLRADLDVLRDDILASDLPTDLRRFLLEYVEDMSRALWDYQLRGIAAIEDVHDRIVGTLHRRTDLMARLREQDPEGAAGRFVKFLYGVAALLVVVGGTLAIPGQVSDMLDAIEGKPDTPAVIEMQQDSPPPPTTTSE